MPRRRYYRRPYRVVAAKKKWASNIKQGNLSSGDPSAVLVQNSTQSSAPTPIIVKAGNFKIKGDVVTTSNATYHQAFLWILFAPEGISGTSSDLTGSLTAHPEWIIGWTALDVPYNSGTAAGGEGGSSFSITTRLKRNLNSGDRIYLFLQTIGDTSASVSYTAQYFTCAN